MGVSLSPATLLNGQGIDVSALVQQVISESSGQLTGWQNEQTTLQSQASDLNVLNVGLGNLQTTIQALSDPTGVLTSQTATSSNNSVLTATTGSGAIAETHQIVVTNLATPGLVYSSDFAAGADTSILPSGQTSGEIDLQIGGGAGNGGSTQPITITAGSNDTLNTLASYINAQNYGVQASVVTDANGATLSLASTSTGTGGALAITSNNTSLAFNTPSGGANANLTIDGVPYSSASNTITGALPGVTLNLASASPGNPVQLTVGTNATDITTAINNFVSAYNQIIGDLNQEYTVNPATKTEGPLGADTSVRDLQSSLLADAAFSVSGNGGYVNLASLGINTNNDGTLTVDSTQLSAALASNPSAVQNFFQNSSATGFANNFNTDLTGLTDPTAGPLNVDLTQNTAEQTDLTNTITNFQTQLTAETAQLTTEFDQVNASLQAYPLLLQQVTATLATLGTGGTTTTADPTLTSGL